LVSGRFERADLTAPIVFVLVGAVLAALGLVDPSSAPEELKPVVELTLVWVLFCDAARVRGGDLRRDLGRYVRLLGVACRSPSSSGGCWRSGSSPGSTCGSRCSSPRHWRRRTRRWVCRS
jgi:hypothetical protein